MDTIKISCNVCLDLIPLVRDGVASDESKKAVLAHIDTCEKCQLEFNGNVQDYEINDKKIILKIKKSLGILCCIMLILGTILGILITNSSGVFYNFLIMPIIGALGVVVFKKRWYLSIIGVFLLSYIGMTIINIAERSVTSAPFYTVFLSGLPYTIIFPILALIGAVIAMLLQFAFRKEEIK